MPARGNQASKHSYSSSLAPGPPCSSSTLRSGLLPTRLVQTRYSPPGVLTGTIRDPPEITSRRSQEEVTKYEEGGWVMMQNLAGLPAKLVQPVVADAEMVGALVNDGPP